MTKTAKDVTPPTLKDGECLLFYDIYYLDATDCLDATDWWDAQCCIATFCQDGWFTIENRHCSKVMPEWTCSPTTGVSLPPEAFERLRECIESKKNRENP